MGRIYCANHGKRGKLACWGCDGCPDCSGVGRLMRGDYCKACTAKAKAAGYVWNKHTKNFTSKESLEKDAWYFATEKKFYIHNANKFVSISASGDWKEGVPKGYVEVTFMRGGRYMVNNGKLVGNYGAETFVAMLPEAEYADRGTFGKVIDWSTKW